MKNLILMTALLATALPGHTAHAYTTDSPPAFLVDGKALDPICFLNDWSQTPPEESGDGKSFYPVEGCSIGEIKVEPDENERYVSASYSEDFYDDEADEVYTTHGWIGYRYIGETVGHHAFITVENGGGSGTFSNIALYDLGTHDMNGTPVTVLKKIKTLGGGDRCMGGIVDGTVDDKGLRYSQNVTPYDMMFLAGDPERAIMQSDAANRIDACAPCCYARAHFSGDRFTGMTLNRDNIDHLEPGDGDGQESVMECLDGLVKMNLEYGDGVFDAEGTAIFIREIEHTCLGAEEGGE